ncbi:hypothetical protein D9M68_416560 [compost metagenome]
MHAGEQVGIDDVAGATVNGHLLVALLGIGFFRGDESRADISQVCTCGLCGQDRIAIANGARQQQRAFKPLANFMQEGERRLHAGMAARTSRHRDQAVGTLFNGFLRELIIEVHPTFVWVKTAGCRLRPPQWK